MKAMATLTLIAALLMASACSRSRSVPTPPPETLLTMAPSIESVMLANGEVVRVQGTRLTAEWGDSAVVVRNLGRQRCDALGQNCRLIDASITVYSYADINSVLVREHSVGRTVATIILVPLVAVGVLAAVAFASSCPIVYAWDGSGYRRAAEPLGGATTRGLQRVDLSRLEHLAPADGHYRVMVQNEMDETQYIASLSLLAVDHAPGTEVHPDRTGALHVVRDRAAPLSATLADGTDVTKLVEHQDDMEFSFDMMQTLTTPPESLRDTLTIEFSRPATSNEVSLVLGAQTTLWGAHMLRQMLELWGGDVGEWYQLLDGSRAARVSNEEWATREEHVVLQVWVEEDGGWRMQEVAIGSGPIEPEVQVVPIDLSRVSGDVVRVRLHPPRGFWAINSIGLATDEGTPGTATEIRATSAIDHLGESRVELVSSDETGYLEMPEVGDRLELEFPVPSQAAGTERTVFAVTEGYYRIHTDLTKERQAAVLDSLWLEPDFGTQLGMRAFPAWVGSSEWKQLTGR